VKLAGIELDRKAMADLAMNEGGVFTAVIAQAKAALPAVPSGRAEAAARRRQTERRDPNGSAPFLRERHGCRKPLQD
jgi:hypothetical protein